MPLGPLPRLVLRVDVRGASMLPTLIEGQRVTALRRWRRLREGDVVVAIDPTNSERRLIKRVVRVSGSDVQLEGDNADASTDSRDFGPVRASNVRFIVLASSMK